MTKVVVVTGASRGIGADTAKRTAAAGYAVIVNYASHETDARAVVEAITAKGGRAEAVRADMADEADIIAMFGKADTLGTLAGLVNNAGYLGGESRVEDYDVPAMGRLWAVNVTACFICAREAIRRMSKNRGGAGGVIINVSSMASHTGGQPNRVHYASTKGALNTFTRGLAKEVGRDGIRVNAVLPGFIDTHFNDDYDNDGRNRRFLQSIPAGRIGVGDDVARAIVWLLSEDAAYLSGECIGINGGMF